jgi:hypothetical protein
MKQLPAVLQLQRLVANPRKSRYLHLMTRLHLLNVSYTIKLALSIPLLIQLSSRLATSQEEANDKQITSSDVTQNNPTPSREDVEMADSTKLDDTVPTADGSAESTTGTPASAGKAKPRRKSGGIPEHKGKKLNKKASKAKMVHSDAKPGDYFYVRLKGYPLWPAIVCDESMLPNTLIKSRPVTAARPDGSYRADFEDGGPKVKDRSFPVMYLYTNEL